MNQQNELQNDKSLKDMSTSCTDTSCCPPKNPVTRKGPKIGRNDPCICGNGLKYKKCCGRNA